MIIGSKLYRTQTTADSMGWARSLIHEAPDGAIFLADEYTNLRGRQGRTWCIMPGQLVVTMVLKPPLLKLMHSDDLSIRLNQLNMAISLGILDPLKKYGASLKWPNDVMLNQKKCGGQLLQVIWEGDIACGLVAGFALNVNNTFPPDHELFPIATSLTETTQLPIDMRGLYKEILIAIDAWYAAWQQMAFASIYKAWRDEQQYLGKSITVHQKNGSICSGIAQQVMPNGDLLITDDNKKQQSISFFQVEEVQLKT
jgi:BirA family biotin operon repressor/biotin-[acetyl-CoA-carboxylase] ligase